MAGNASAIQVRRIREVTQGVLPGGAMQIVPFETFQLSGALTREQPGNVTADRSVTDNPASDIKVTGTAKSDFLFGDYDGLIEELMCGTIGTPFSLTASTIAAVVAGPSNKLTGPASSWVGLGDGDVVLVTGFVTNGGLWIARVSGAPTSTDLNLDASFKPLAAEAAGPSVTVEHLGRWRTGTTILTAAYESWNTGTSVGNQMGGVGVGQLVLGVPQPNKCTMQWQCVGLTETEIAAQLANTSTQPTGNPLINSNTNFGDKTAIGSGMGFRYGNSGIAVPTLPLLMPTLRIKKWDLTIASPILAEGGAGVLGPIDLSSDKRFDIKLALQVFRNSAAAETVYLDAQNPASVVQMGIGFRDAKGHRQYIWLPALQPLSAKTSGLAQSGREMIDVEYWAKSDGGAVGMIQWSKC